MKGFACEIYRYRLPLTQPLGALSEREGLLLRIVDPMGYSGWGDAAPLPGFSSDTWDEAFEALQAIVTSDDELGVVAARPWPPSAAFAVLTAIHGYGTALRGESMAAAFDPGHPPVLPVQPLLAGTEDAIVAKAEALRRSDCPCKVAKLKVGDVDGARAVGRVRAVLDTLGPAYLLRLDANRAWTFEEAADFGRAIAGLAVAYVEEPLAEWERLAELDLPYALDESLREPSLPTAILEGAKALILKPSLMRLEDLPRLPHTPVVVSAAFESGVGMAGLVACACMVDQDCPAGLDTYAWLAEDVLEERLPLAPGVVALDAVAKAAETVCLDRLERVV